MGSMNRPAPAIDTYGALPDRRVLGSWLRAFGGFAGYRRLFAAPMARMAGIDPIDAADVSLDVQLDRLSPLFLPVESFAEVIDQIGLAAMVIWAHVFADDPSGLIAVAEARQQFPNRFHALPSYDPAITNRVGRVAADNERYGLAGVTLLPIVDNRPADDPANDSLFAYCSDQGLVVWIHSVNTWSERHPSDYSHPRFADRVACRYPDLRIVLGHGGWPWVDEAVAIAWRHPNVYLEPSAFRYQHMTKPGSGWAPLLCYGDTTIRSKVIFGSLWPNLGLPLPAMLDEARSLPLRPESIRAWTYENAKRLYRLGDLA